MAPKYPLFTHTHIFFNLNQTRTGAAWWPPVNRCAACAAATQDPQTHTRPPGWSAMFCSLWLAAADARSLSWLRGCVNSYRLAHWQETRLSEGFILYPSSCAGCGLKAYSFIQNGYGEIKMYWKGHWWNDLSMCGSKQVQVRGNLTLCK